MDSGDSVNRRTQASPTGSWSVWAFLLWFAISDVALIRVGDRWDLPGGVAYLWIVLHYAVNPVLACFVAASVVMRAIRCRERLAIGIAFVIAPVLVLIAYLGFTRNAQWLELWGVTMRTRG